MSGETRLRDPAAAGAWPGVLSEPAAPASAPRAPREIVIQPTRGLVALRLREMWEYRDLLFALTWREVSVRYKQTLLGVTWAVLQPLVAMVVFSVFLGRFAGVPSDGAPYPIFVYLGLLPWTYFQGAVGRASGSLVQKAGLVTKVYFPRALVPLSATLAALADLFFATLVLVGLMAWYGFAPSSATLIVPLLLLLTTAAATGIGLFLSALNVRYRDVMHAVPFVLQIWMFATPVVFPSSVVPASLRPLLALNPMTGVIDGCRAAVLGTRLPWEEMLLSTVIVALLLVVGVWQFRRMERSFADEI